MQSHWPDYARLISDRKWPLKKRQVIAHIKVFLLNYYLKRLIRPNKACRRVPATVCSVCVRACALMHLCASCACACACALMQVLLLPIGCDFTSQCLDIGA